MLPSSGVTQKLTLTAACRVGVHGDARVLWLRVVLVGPGRLQVQVADDVRQGHPQLLDDLEQHFRAEAVVEVRAQIARLRVEPDRRVEAPLVELLQGLVREEAVGIKGRRAVGPRVREVGGLQRRRLPQKPRAQGPLDAAFRREVDEGVVRPEQQRVLLRAQELLRHELAPLRPLDAPIYSRVGVREVPKWGGNFPSLIRWRSCSPSCSSLNAAAMKKLPRTWTEPG